MQRRHEPPDGAPPPERENAAPSVQAKGGVNHETACDGSFSYNVYPARLVRSTVILRPIWSDEHVFSGWLTEAEALALSQGARA